MAATVLCEKSFFGLFQIAQKQIYGTKLTNMVTLILSNGHLELWLWKRGDYSSIAPPQVKLLYSFSCL